ATDAAWNDLRLWQDRNNDGQTQADELSRPADHGIVAFNTTATNDFKIFGGTTYQLRSGTYTKQDGSSGQIGEMQFELNPVDTKPTQAVTVDALALGALPNLKGSGKVRSLWDAMSLGTPQAAALTAAVARFDAATTRSEQQALLDDVLVAWADTSGMAKTLDDRANGYAVEYLALGRDSRSRHRVDPTTPANATPITAGRIRNADDPQLDAAYRAKIAEVNRVIHVAEAFNGEYFYNAPGASSETRGATEGMSVYYGGSAYHLNLAHDGRPVVGISLNDAQITPLYAAYASLRESAWRSLVLQTRLQPLLDRVQTVTDEQGRETTDTSLLTRELQHRIEADPVAGLGDLLDIDKYAGMGLIRSGWTGMNDFDSLLQTLPDTPQIQALLREFKVSVNGVPSIDYTAGNIVVRGDGNDVAGGGSASGRPNRPYARPPNRGRSQVLEGKGRPQARPDRQRTRAVPKRKPRPP
ncbi:MAG: hypothetical protein NT042_10310, partial [Sulfuritalea sp.]|nr:hypothetical protein [Sulfuritalea sp.]